MNYRTPDPTPYSPPPSGRQWTMDYMEYGIYGGLINKKFAQLNIIFFQSRGVRPKRPGRCWRQPPHPPLWDCRASSAHPFRACSCARAPRRRIPAVAAAVAAIRLQLLSLNQRTGKSHVKICFSEAPAGPNCY